MIVYHRKSHTFGYAEKIGHSPELTSTEAAGIFISVQDTTSKSQEDDQPTPLAPTTQDGGDPVTVESKVILIKDDEEAEAKQLEDSTKVVNLCLLLSL